MALQCLTWIPHLWSQLVSSITLHHKGFVRPFPDDIVIDILSRLPAECVLQCRKVCRSWLALTSTPYFAEIHLKRAAPVLFVQWDPVKNMLEDKLHWFIFYEEAKKDKFIMKMCAESMHIWKQHIPVLCGSCDGLLVFQPMFQFIIYFVWNPVTQEQVTISSPVNPNKLCGFFFHALTKEYRLLYVHRKGICFEYSIYSLGGKLWREIGAFSYRPSAFPPTSFVNHAILNGALHWMVEHKCEDEYNISPCSNSIMMFNMDTEDFCSMPHPGKECRSLLNHDFMHLLEMKGELSFSFLYANLINDIWVLEDYENWFWVKKYKVNLDWDVGHYPFELSHFYPDYFNCKIRLLNFQNGELLLDWYSRGLFRYHLGQNTVKKIERAGMKMPTMLLHHTCYSTVYIKSFISPMGFQ